MFRFISFKEIYDYQGINVHTIFTPPFMQIKLIVVYHYPYIILNELPRLILFSTLRGFPLQRTSPEPEMETFNISITYKSVKQNMHTNIIYLF